MLTIRRILCPIDFSDFSRSALDLAFALAARSGAEITALHVTAASFPPMAAFPEVPALFPLDAAVMERLRAELASFVAPSRTPDVPLRTVVAEGAPVTTILIEAEALRADLIVMGTHGVGGFERWVLGSVAEKVLRKAPCPVLTVTRARPEPFPLAGLDLSAYRSQRCQDARQRLRALAKDVPCPHDEIVKTGKPYGEILALAEQREAGLVVVGVHGRRFRDMFHFGSTAHHVVRGAECPVLTVRASRS